MSKRILNRREFLRTAGKVAASVVVLSGATTMALGCPSSTRSRAQSVR